MIYHSSHRLKCTCLPPAGITQIIIFAICYSLLVALGGCGYTSRSIISDKFKTIYIVPFVNKIDITQEGYSASKYKLYRPTVETDITKRVTNKYLFDGNLKPTQKESADLILKGEVVDFRKDPLAYNDSDEVAEYRLNLVVNISLWDTREKKFVWEEKDFTGDTTYFTSFASGDVTKKTEDSAITDALDDLARRIVERTVEQW